MYMLPDTFCPFPVFLDYNSRIKKRMIEEFKYTQKRPSQITPIAQLQHDRHLPVFSPPSFPSFLRGGAHLEHLQQIGDAPANL